MDETPTPASETMRKPWVVVTSTVVFLAAVFWSGFVTGRKTSTWNFYSDMEAQGIDRETASAWVRRSPKLLDEINTENDIVAVQAAVTVDAIDSGDSGKQEKLRVILVKRIREYADNLSGHDDDSFSDQRRTALDRVNQTLSRIGDEISESETGSL